MVWVVIDTRASHDLTYGESVERLNQSDHPDHAVAPVANGLADPSPAPGMRLRVRLHRRRLDRELAQGLDPESWSDRALRARQLTNARTRRRIARGLRGVVASADRPSGPVLSAAPPACRTAVVPWREALLGLADRLQQPGLVNPCGVARALVLLTDGTGPLYNPGPERPIDEMIWWVVDGLQPC
jgi:hypothetical protein